MEGSQATMPGERVVSTAADMFTLLRNAETRGELNGARIFADHGRECAALLDRRQAQRALTARSRGRGWEVLPAYIGLGFTLRARAWVMRCSARSLAETFGNNGAGTRSSGSILCSTWSFVGLTTA